jgi:TPR repeat protein
VATKEDAKRVFSALGQDDARALCFARLLGDREDLTLLRRSAELGYAFAQALVAWKTIGDEKFKFAQLAASQGERDSLFWLGRCFRDGNGCEKDLVKAKENYLLGSDLGHVSAMLRLGELLDESDPQRWRWRGRGYIWRFLDNFAKQVELCRCRPGCRDHHSGQAQVWQACHFYCHRRRRSTTMSVKEDFRF